MQHHQLNYIIMTSRKGSINQLQLFIGGFLCKIDNHENAWVVNKNFNLKTSEAN